MGLLGDFHNQVARALKKVDDNPSGGPPQLGRAWKWAGASVWENHKKFMSLTKSDLTLLINMIVAFVQLGAAMKAMMVGQGRLDCVLDLLLR